MAELFDRTGDDRRAIQVDPLTAVAELAWLGLLLTSALLIVGLPLAVLGEFRAALVLPAAVVVALAARRALAPPKGWSASLPKGGTSRGAALVMLAIVGLAAFGNMRWAGQHHATNRDPGVYLESGLWLGEHGTLLIDGRTGPFLSESSLRGGGSGFNEIADGSGRLVSQFPHGTAVVIAAGQQIGGIRLATRTGGILIALAGLLMWILARRFVGDWWSTLGVAVFSLDIVTMHFARDTFSEPLAAVLIVGLLAVIVWSDSPSHWTFVGILAGLSVAARIDSILVVLGISLVVLVASWTRRKSAVSLVAGLSVGFTIAIVDLVHRSPNYLSDKWPVFRLAMIASMAMIAVAAILIAVRMLLNESALSGRWRAMTEMAARPGVATTVGTLVTATILAVLAFRPHFQQLHGGLNEHIRGLQQRDGMAIDGTRTYGESSLRWIAWYFGWPLDRKSVV